jgi:serine protease inhibitor
MNDNIIKIIAETYRKMQLNEHVPLDDQEGGMVQSQMKSIIEKANDILGMMQQDTQLEAWVQSKLTKAEDYISAVRDYLKNNPNSKE